MKKHLKKVTVIVAFFFLTIASIGASVHASDNQIRVVGTKWVEKFMFQDENKITGAITKYVSKIIEVPSDAYIDDVEKYLMYEEWNYRRYEITYWYRSSLGYH